MKYTLAVLLSVCMLFTMAGCAAKDTTGKYKLDKKRNEAIIQDVAVAETNENTGLFYEIFVGSFSDSDGDGTGDLRGIINRFDYLNDGDPNSGLSLGVEGIWLTPIFASPSYHKYDTTDYYTIDPKFGTEEDLKELVELCHQRGVKIILDLVINHTSSNHPWFLQFTEAHRSGNTASEYYDYYSWAVEAGGSKTMRAINGTEHLYECNFSGSMPELNYDNPAVREKMLEIAGYYLELGVDGFRFDAAKYVYFGEESRNVEFWQWFMGKLREIKPDIYTVAEVWDGDGVVIPYTSATNCFNFSMAQVSGHISQTAQAGDVNTLMNYVESYLQQIQAQNPDAQMVTFIANHDTDRAAGFLPLSNNRAKVAANLAMLMPGSTFLYYGEEIGIKGARGGANTDANRRLAMLWGDEDTVKDPVGANYTSGQSNGTVADQLPNGDSLYNYYKRLIQIRKAYPAIALGEFTRLEITGSKAGGFVSTYKDQTVAVLHNTTGSSVQIDLASITDVPLTELAAVIGVGGASLEGSVLTLDSQTSVVLK